MRTLSFLVALGLSYSCHAEVSSLDHAWKYLIAPGGSWVLITSNGHKGYFQCERLDTFVRCPLSVWRKALPGTKTTFEGRSRGEPYPVPPGSETKIYLTERQLKAAKLVLKRFGVAGHNIHTQLFDVETEKKAVGARLDLTIVLDLTYERFPELVEAFMVEVWGAGAEKGYAFETDD